jgi:hypothetical protein
MSRQLFSDPTGGLQRRWDRLRRVYQQTKEKNWSANDENYRSRYSAEDINPPDNRPPVYAWDRGLGSARASATSRSFAQPLNTDVEWTQRDAQNRSNLDAAVTSTPVKAVHFFPTTVIRSSPPREQPNYEPLFSSSEQNEPIPISTQPQSPVDSDPPVRVHRSKFNELPPSSPLSTRSCSTLPSPLSILKRKVVTNEDSDALREGTPLASAPEAARILLDFTKAKQSEVSTIMM